MRSMRLKLAALGAAVVLAACGGGDSGFDFTSTVSFGDSLSDVGTYKVGTIAAVGGGKWTVNGSTAMNWTEIVAAGAGTPAPCAAQTGLLTNIPGLVGAPVTDVPGCLNYAQGSSRVSQLFAPNSATLQAAPFNQVNLGLLAVPITTQMSRHLANVGGAYSGTELVTVLAGGNDLFMNFGGVASAAAGGATAVGGAIAAGWSAEVQASVSVGGTTATNAAINAAVAGMGAAGAELATLIKTQVVAKGARFVVVVNLPDASESPFGQSLDAQTRGLLTTLITTFNSQLQTGLSGANVLYVDAYARGRQQTANPAQFGITNLTTPACSTTSPNNPLQGSSLACTSASTVAADTSGFLYADSVHPTPLGYRLLGDYVLAQMRAVGWL
ncbi:MAG TPA: SGNH/GDSL hydrolase family protein [Ramlibacter sp.]|nr:SGNH/GDSL hydrolase family protein [Ramlibacter sp.]